MQRSLTNRLGNEICESLLIDHNVKLEPIFRNGQIQSFQRMRQVRLVRSVAPHFSYVAFITHVFNNNEGSLNSHSLDSNLP